MNDNYARKVIDDLPYPFADPVQRLRHTVANFAEEPDGGVAVMATSGIYPADATVSGIDRGQTGLTHGDLRELLRILEDHAPVPRYQGSTG